VAGNRSEPVGRLKAHLLYSQWIYYHEDDNTLPMAPDLRFRWFRLRCIPENSSRKLGPSNCTGSFSLGVITSFGRGKWLDRWR